MKKLCMLAVGLLSLHAMAENGFIRAMFPSGSSIDKTSSIWDAAGAIIVEGTEDVVHKQNYDFATQTTYAYGTYMYLEGGKTYIFRSKVDDRMYVKIDDTVLIDNGAETCVSFHFENSGYHKLELRFFNNTGPGGGTAFDGCTFCEDESGVEWKRFHVANGDFKTEQPTGYVSTVPVVDKFSGAFKEIADPTGYVGDIVIRFDEKVKSNAFANNTAITSVTLKGGVIESSAFSGCTSITNVVLSGTVGTSAFSGCTSITNVVLSGTVGASAFSGCENLQSVKVVGSVSATGQPFAIPSLETVEWGTEGAISVGGQLFGGCTGLESVVIPANVTIDGDAFYDCVALSSVSIEEGVVCVQGFYGCTEIISVRLPESVKEIGENAFRDCTYLAHINMPLKLQKIGNDAFSGCDYLSPVRLPASVLELGSGAFAGCKSFNGTFIIPDGITELPSSLFENCSGITGFSIPNSVKRIGNGVFKGCASLQTLVLPDIMEQIGGFRLFYGCYSLRSIQMPKKLFQPKLSISECFVHCRSLVEVDIPEGVEELYGYYDPGHSNPPFIGTSVHIILPSTLKKIDDIFHIWSGRVTFKGDLPFGYEYIPNEAEIVCLRSTGSLAQSLTQIHNFIGFYQFNAPKVTIVSSKIRESDPTILDVKYRVDSQKDTVKVRALAFKDGERSLAKVVRPETFVDGTAANIGDGIAANEEHTLSWKVASDWQTTLADVSFEVLAVEDAILPLELSTIPGTEDHPATIQVSWNYVTSDRLFDALLWLYADKDLGLTLKDGVLNNGDVRLASGSAINGTGYDAAVYIYGKMGYGLLQGAELEYAKSALRLDLPNPSVRQYAYKVVTGSEGK